MSFLQIPPVCTLSPKLIMGTFFCSLFFCLGQHEMPAQQLFIRIEGGGKGKLEVYKQFNNLYEGKRNAAKKRLESRLLEIDRVCELTSKQRTHLEVAAKGAVDTYSKKFAQKLEQDAKRYGFEFKRGNPPEVDPDDENDEGLGRRGARIIDVGGGRNGDFKATVDTEKIWVSSIKKTLTETQAEKLTSWAIAKQRTTRQAAVDYFVAKADLKLFLSPDQSKKLAAYLDREFGLLLVEQMKLPPKQRRNIVLAGVPQPNRDIDVDDALVEFLSEPQLEIWKTDFQDVLDSLDD